MTFSDVRQRTGAKGVAARKGAATTVSVDHQREEKPPVGRLITSTGDG
jgi:hypothetical protein